MHYSSIQLINFRNYKKQNLKLHQGVNVFVGQNGQGKTNLLESLHFLSRGKSFRPGDNLHYVLNGRDQSSIQGVLVDGQLKNLVKVHFKEDKKEIFLNQKKTNGPKLSKLAPSVLFSPESLSSIKEGPDQRRALIDEWLVTFSLKNYQVLSNFKRSLQQRNRLLKNIKTEKVSRAEGIRLLEALNPIYSSAAIDLTRARMEALETIEPMLARGMLEITGEAGRDVDISVDYQISGESVKGASNAEIKAKLIDRLAELAGKELLVGHSLVGPHKHDITFLFNDQDSRYHCSQGQQRALILSFKMAQIVYHYRVYQSYPIMLLDDVLSELDKNKQQNLIRFINRVDSQILITTTDFEFEFHFGDKELAIFHVQEGLIETKH